MKVSHAVADPRGVYNLLPGTAITLSKVIVKTPPYSETWIRPCHVFAALIAILV